MTTTTKGNQKLSPLRVIKITYWITEVCADKQHRLCANLHECECGCHD